MDVDLKNAEILPLDEAACVLLGIRRSRAWGRLDAIDRREVDRKIIEIVKAIRANELDTIPLPEDVLAKRGDSIRPNIYIALFTPADGGQRLLLPHEDIDDLASSCGIKGEDLTRFAKTRGYLAPTLLGGTPSNGARVAAYASHAEEHKAKQAARNLAADFNKNGWPDFDEVISHICEEVSKYSRKSRYKDRPYTRETIIKWISDIIPESYRRKPGRPKKVISKK